MKNGPYTLIIPPPEYPGKLYRGRYAYEHTVVFWLNTKTLPPEGFCIHHKNMNHRDNRIENLELMTRKDHSSHHIALTPNMTNRAVYPQKMIDLVCSYCGKDFSLPVRVFKVRSKKNKTKFLFCSQACLHKHPINSGIKNLSKK